MSFDYFHPTFLYESILNVFVFSDTLTLSADFETRSQDIISNSIRLEKEHGDTKFAEISEQKLQDLCESLKDESKNRFDLIEKNIREIYIHGANIKPRDSFMDFMLGFYELLDLALDHIPGMEKNPNNIVNYFEFLEDMLGIVEREEYRLSWNDMKAIDKRIAEKGGYYPGARIFTEIELRREGIIKDRK